jgi:hypothetical protein
MIFYYIKKNNGMKTKQKKAASPQSEDTSRTSNQGKKISSGGTKQKRKGNPEMNEETNSPKTPGKSRAGR